MKTLVIAILVLFLFCAKNVESAVEDTVMILFNSDSYGMLQPCMNCPSAGGGIAPKIYLRDSLNTRYQGRFINLQGGGFTAGGEFDRYKSSFRVIDSLRTVYKLKSFPAMNYDVVGVGHEDYKYTGLFERKQQRFGIPAVSLNVLKQDSSHLFEPYIIIERLGRKIAVTSITGRSDYIERKYIHISPFEPLKNFLNTMKNKVDGFIILNYYGDDSIPKIANVINSVDVANRTVIFNSYTKRVEPRSYLYEVDSVAVVNFDFLSRSSIIATGVFWDNNFTVSRALLYGLTHRAPVSPKGVTLVQKYDNEKQMLLLGRQKINIEMFVSRTCPHCKRALSNLQPFLKDTNVTMTLFETDYDKEGEGKMSPFLLGYFFDVDKFFENAMSMQSVFPPDVNVDSLMALLEPSKMEKYYQRRNYLLEKYDIFAVPDIFINGVRLENEDLRNLVGYVCRNFKYNNLEHCKTQPECVTAFDCPNVPRMSAECNAERKCVYSSDLPKMYVIYDSRAIFPYDTVIIEQTKQKVAFLEVEFIDFNSLDKQSDKLKLYTGMLPLYIVNNSVYNSSGLANFRRYFEASGSYYKLTENVATPTIIQSRDFVAGEARMFVSLFNALSNSREIFEAIAEKYSANQLSLGFVLQKDSEGNLKSLGNKRELEQIERIRAVEILYPNKKGEYLKNWIKDPFSDNWHKPLKESGIDPFKIYNAIKNRTVDLKLEEDFKVFELETPRLHINFMVNNIEVLEVPNPDFIGKVIEKLEH